MKNLLKFATCSITTGFLITVSCSIGFSDPTLVTKGSGSPVGYEAATLQTAENNLKILKSHAAESALDQSSIVSANVHEVITEPSRHEVVTLPATTGTKIVEPIRPPAIPVAPPSSELFASLAPQEQAEWRQFCEKSYCAGGPAAYFQDLYSQWKQNSFQMLDSALADLGSAERNDPYHLQETLFIASLFVDPKEHTIQFYNQNIVGATQFTGLAYKDGPVLHLWNYEFALTNGKITGVLNDGKGNGYNLLGPIDVPKTVSQRIPDPKPASDEGLILIKTVDKYGNPVNGVFIGVFDGSGWKELEDHNIGTYTDSKGNTFTGVKFFGETKSASVPLAVCKTSPSFSCSYPTVTDVTAGSIRIVTVTVS